MPRLKVMSGRDVRALLEANGFTFARQRGSHMILTLTIENEEALNLQLRFLCPTIKNLLLAH